MGMKNEGFGILSSVYELVAFKLKSAKEKKTNSFFALVWWKNSHRSCPGSKQHVRIIFIKFERTL